jgi:hypothetical protein
VVARMPAAEAHTELSFGPLVDSKFATSVFYCDTLRRSRLIRFDL